MFHIAVCDDEKKYCEEMQQKINRYAEKNDCEICVDCYYSGEALWLAYEKQYDILILDVEMTGIDGVHLAENIRKTDEEVVIIFSTSHRQYALDGYRVEAAGYMVKPFSEEMVSRELEKAFRRIRESRYDLTVSFNGEVTMIAMSQLLYVEVYRHKLIYHLADGRKLRGTGSLKEVKKQDGKGLLVQTHKSFLVNLMWITSYQSSPHLVFVRGREEGVPVSKYRYDEFVETYMEYYRRKLTRLSETDRKKG